MEILDIFIKLTPYQVLILLYSSKTQQQLIHQAHTYMTYILELLIIGELPQKMPLTLQSGRQHGVLQLLIQCITHLLQIKQLINRF